MYFVPPFNQILEVVVLSKHSDG